MIALELLALIAMATVFVSAFVGSARSHTRTRAWHTPAVVVGNVVRTAATDDTVIDARDRFGANRARPIATTMTAEAA